MIKFVGDICLSDNDFDKGYGVGSMMMKRHNPFGQITKRKEEIWVGNMECVLSESTTRTGYNSKSFRESPEILELDTLIDCYSVANNHIMEHGSIAYQDTLETIKKNGKQYVGSKDCKTIVLDDCGKRVAISSFSLRCDNTGFEPDYWYNPDMDELKAECERYFDVDIKIAYIHWGVEFIPYPYLEQQKLAHYLVDFGYDLIIGVHPHVLQGLEIYKGKPIYYSLGNFVFNMAYPDTRIGLVVSYDPIKQVVSHEYVEIDSTYSPKLISQDEVSNSLRIHNLSPIIGRNSNIEQYVRDAGFYLKKYRRYHHMAILKNLFKYDFSFLRGMISTFIKSRIS